ncbi:MAG: hypothetical protein PHV43_02700 [Candidatus Colwellbacteria bacterium]|nr:hypothetical protein [Candidatus Colwellbacteria bacterium]
MSLGNTADILVASFQQLWIDFVGFLPTFFSALIVFIIGLIVAAAVGQLVEKVIGALKLDGFLARAGLENPMRRAGLRLNVGRFLGRLTYWFILIAFFLAASDILGFYTVSSFLQAVLLFVPQLIVAILILLVTVLAANFLRGVVMASAKSGGLETANFLGALAWWALIIFGVSAAMLQLHIATALIQALMTAIFAMVALAGGIAFGLGGKEYAEHLLKKFRNQVEHR